MDFWPVTDGTISEALAYPGAALASIADFLAARRALLTRHLAAVPAVAGDFDPRSAQR
jgi:hypothetical protein